jgi:hypothetical protein
MLFPMKRLLVPGLAALLLSCLPLAAQSNAVTFSFPAQGGINSARSIWDITGNFTIDLQVAGLGQLLFQIPVVQDARGKLTGPAIIPVKAGTNDLVCAAVVKGAVTGQGANIIVTISVKLVGNGELLGEIRNFKGAFNLALQLDPNTMHLVGTLSGSASASGLGARQLPATAAAFPLAPGMVGSWSLTLHLDAAGTKATGDASIVLSNARTLPFGIKGTLASGDAKSSLKLTGSGNAAGSSVQVNLLGNPPVLNRVSGRVLGITVN